MAFRSLKSSSTVSPPREHSQHDLELGSQPTKFAARKASSRSTRNLKSNGLRPAKGKQNKLKSIASAVVHVDG
eukprot:6179095-Pleurochrysis_carterae.AAC.3